MLATSGNGNNVVELPIGRIAFDAPIAPHGCQLGLSEWMDDRRDAIDAASVSVILLPAVLGPFSASLSVVVAAMLAIESVPILVVRGAMFPVVLVPSPLALSVVVNVLCTPTLVTPRLAGLALRLPTVGPGCVAMKAVDVLRALALGAELQRVGHAFTGAK